MERRKKRRKKKRMNKNCTDTKRHRLVKKLCVHVCYIWFRVYMRGRSARIRGKGGYYLSLKRDNNLKPITITHVSQRQMTRNLFCNFSCFYF